MSNLVDSNYTLCYYAPYGQETTTSDLLNCYGLGIYFVGAIPSSDPTTFSVGAFGTNGIFKLTDSTSTANYDPLGAYWYFKPSYGFGFAPESEVSLNICDFGIENDCSNRLCWHLDNYGLGGFRAGCTIFLNDDYSWYKAIYRTEFAPSPSPTGKLLLVPKKNDFLLLVQIFKSTLICLFILYFCQGNLLHGLLFPPVCEAYLTVTYTFMIELFF